MTEDDQLQCEAAADRAAPSGGMAWLEAFDAEAERLGYEYRPEVCTCPEDVRHMGHRAHCGMVKEAPL